MSIMNSLVMDAFEKIASEASKLMKVNKKQTMTSREIQSALRLVFPPSSRSTPCRRERRP